MSTVTAAKTERSQLYVWDRFVRFFHWTVVLGFAIAYITQDDLLPVHVWAGYVVGLLVLARVVWGFIGPIYARFSDFVYGPAATLSYLRDLISFRAKRYLGHSPAGGAMIVLLLLLLAGTAVTGVMVYGGDQQAGPLAGMLTKESGEALEGVHELLANITLAFVIAHIGAVILAGYVHRENLVRSMITGYKRHRA